MGEKQKAEITFITRHYPPSPNINGESVWDVVKYLKETHGVESNVICIDRTSDGGGKVRQPVGNVIRLKTLFKRQGAFFRFLTFLYDGFVLARRARKYKNTIVVFTTSPPLLPFWASFFFGKRAFWGVWALDLFPEFFAVRGTISKKNWIYRWVKRKSYNAKLSFLIALGPKQAIHLRKEYQREDLPLVTLPCGIPFYQQKSAEIPEWWSEGKIFLGYCGNLGAAHSPDFLKAVIDQLDPEKHQMVLATYGEKAADLLEYAKDKPGVIIVDRVQRDQLHFIDIHCVSLYKKWTHLAVPSKAVSAVASNSSLLFYGDRESDNWYMLGESGWIIDEEQDLSSQVKAFFAQLTLEDIESKKAKTPAIFEELQNYVKTAYEDIADLVKDRRSIG